MTTFIGLVVAFLVAACFLFSFLWFYDDLVEWEANPASSLGDLLCRWAYAICLAASFLFVLWFWIAVFFSKD